VNSGDTFHVKGVADERHHHDQLEQKIRQMEIRLAELRAEWDEFVAAALDDDPGDPQ
jgi:TolA-binding protein